MRAFLLILLLPTLAIAAEDSPLIIIDAGRKPAVTATTPLTPQPAAPPTATTPAKAPPAVAAAEAIIEDFPAWAISKAGSDTTGQTTEVVPSPPNPATPAAPDVPAAPPAPAAPESPASPISALWPRDTVPIFMHSCTSLHVEYVAACSCVIRNLMLAIPHNEFLELSVKNAVDADPRVVKIRNQCLATPGKRKE